MTPWLIGAGILVALLFIIVAIYNQLVTLRNRFQNGFSQIDVQLKRRYDLIPNLVEATRAYLQHERATLEAVIAARNNASNARLQASLRPGDGEALHALAGAEGALTGAMTRFMALAEAYPDLKSNQNVSDLTEELSSTENRVAFARQAFNDAVTEYNTSCQKFPHFVIASLCRFQQAELFEAESSAIREAPKVRLS